MLGSLNQIGKHSQTRYNSGYLTKVYLVPTTDVKWVELPTQSLSLHDQCIVLLPGASVTEIVCKPKTATLTDSMQPGEPATYLTEVTIPILTEAPELTSWAFLNANRRWVVVAMDTLGNAYCIGSHDNGGRLGWGRQIAGRHVQSLVIRTSSLSPAAWINSLDPELIFSTDEFNYNYGLYTLTYMSTYRYKTINILAVRSGDYFEMNFQVSVPSDLTGWTARSQVRKFPTDTVVGLELDVEIDGQAVMLSKASNQMNLPGGMYYYDVEFTDPEGRDFTLFGGKFEVLSDVTR